MGMYVGTAELYNTYRNHYSSAFFEKLFAECKINNDSVVMDLGCGPGTVALDIAPMVRKVIAVDIEEDFIEKGKALAAEKKITNIEWHVLPAEQISVIGKMANMIIISRAFHWMDREKVAEQAYRMITPGGVLVIAKDITTRHWNTKEIEKLVDKYALKENFAKKIGKVVPYTEILSQAGFRVKELVVDEAQRKSSPDMALGWYLSTSFANQNVLGSKLEEFQTHLNQELKKLPKDCFIEDVQSEAVIGFK